MNKKYFFKIAGPTNFTLAWGNQTKRLFANFLNFSIPLSRENWNCCLNDKFRATEVFTQQREHSESMRVSSLPLADPSSHDAKCKGILEKLTKGWRFADPPPPWWTHTFWTLHDNNNRMANVMFLLKLSGGRKKIWCAIAGDLHQ